MPQRQIQTNISTHKDHILKTLYKNFNQFVSGEALSRNLNLTRTSIWKHINTLVKEGYKIERKTKSGYRLYSIPDIIIPFEIEENSNTSYIGKKIYYYHKISSTNEIAAQLAKEDAPSGAIVISEIQTKGKGRQGREWISPHGGLWVSTILRPDFLPEDASKITLIWAISIAQAIHEIHKLNILIKWPNDLILNNKKLCGILTEMNAEIDKINHLIIGFGMNINNSLPDSLSTTSTSLKKEIGQSLNRTLLLNRILENIETNLEIFNKKGFEPFLDTAKKLSYLLGEKVKVTIANKCFTGTCMNLDTDGNLIIKLLNGQTKKIVSGDIMLLRKK